GHGKIGSERDLAFPLQDSLDAGSAFEEEDEVGGLGAGLESETTSRQADERRRAPRVALFAHEKHPSAIAPADQKTCLDHPRNNRDALSVFEQRGGNALERDGGEGVDHFARLL